MIIAIPINIPLRPIPIGIPTAMAITITHTTPATTPYGIATNTTITPMNISMPTDPISTTATPMGPRCSRNAARVFRLRLNHTQTLSLKKSKPLQCV